MHVCPLWSVEILGLNLTLSFFLGFQLQVQKEDLVYWIFRELIPPLYATQCLSILLQHLLHWFSVPLLHRLHLLESQTVKTHVGQTSSAHRWWKLRQVLVHTSHKVKPSLQFWQVSSYQFQPTIGWLFTWQSFMYFACKSQTRLII